MLEDHVIFKLVRQLVHVWLDAPNNRVPGDDTMASASCSFALKTLVTIAMVTGSPSSITRHKKQLQSHYSCNYNDYGMQAIMRLTIVLLLVA